MAEYLNNAIFQNLLLNYQSNPGDKKAGDELAKAFGAIGENLSKKYKMAGVSLEDAVQESMIIGFIRLDKFKPEKGKAFNYFTTIILNHLRGLYRQNKSFVDMKERYAERLREKAGTHWRKPSHIEEKTAKDIQAKRYGRSD